MQKGTTENEAHETLSAELYAGALREVRASYEHYNEIYFSGRLLLPQFQWANNRGEWGAWLGESRTLSLSTQLLAKGWGYLMEVLKHEMAHQYVYEVEPPLESEGPHGTRFKEVCRARGIDSRAAGEIFDQYSEADSSLEDDKQRAVLTRIRHLLALAKSDNQHEAEVAMATARKLMLRYNLSEQSLSGENGDYTIRYLGKVTGRRQSWQSILAALIGEHFFVQIIIIPIYRPELGKRGSIVEASGTETNLEMAAYAHDFLEVAALSCWKRHKKERNIQRDGDKQSFLHGVMLGFGAKLDAEAAKNQQEGLVWLGDPELGRYFRARHPHTRNIAGRGRARNEAFSAGHNAGGRIVLHRGLDAGSNGGAPKRLGAKRST